MVGVRAMALGERWGSDLGERFLNGEQRDDRLATELTEDHAVARRAIPVTRREYNPFAVARRPHSFPYGHRPVLEPLISVVRELLKPAAHHAGLARSVLLRTLVPEGGGCGEEGVKR